MYDHVRKELEEMSELNINAQGNSQYWRGIWFKFAVLAVHAVCYALLQVAECCAHERITP